MPQTHLSSQRHRRGVLPDGDSAEEAMRWDAAAAVAAAAVAAAVAVAASYRCFRAIPILADLEHRDPPNDSIPVSIRVATFLN